MIKQLLTITLATAMLAACSKEENNMTPQTVTDFVMLQTDPVGNPAYITDDNEQVFEVTACHYKPEGMEANTRYRVMLDYTITEMPEDGKAGKAESYSFTSVILQHVIPMGQFMQKVYTDPVEVKRIWKKGKYINMELGVPGKDKPHGIMYVEKSTGMKGGTSEIILYHNNNDDQPAFTKVAYLTIMIEDVTNYSPDSVAVFINTNEGMKRFAYYVGE